MTTKQLTTKQRDYLQAAMAHDSVNSERLDLRVLNNLANKGLLEAFDSEMLWNGNRQIVHFFITDAGRTALQSGSDIRTVSIPTCAEHAGDPFNSIRVHLRWVCPNCGTRRGDPYETISYDGSRRLHVHGWNPCKCGHVDKYAAVLEEAKSNGLNARVLS